MKNQSNGVPCFTLRLSKQKCSQSSKQSYAPAPTWAAPAPATWAAPAPAAEVNGCRATWLSGVSETTFSKDLCTLSGYWTAKFASESTAITATNTVTIATVDGGYESLVNAVSNVKFTGGAAAGDDITATMTLGYANDLTKSILVNPLGHTGLSYCMCEAIQAGCDPKQSGAAVPASPIKTAPYELGTTAEMTLPNYVAAAAAVPHALYLTGSAALEKEYTGLGVQTLAAISLTGISTTIDSQREVDAILALGRGLNSKLDECVPVNIVTAL